MTTKKQYGVTLVMSLLILLVFSSPAFAADNDQFMDFGVKVSGEITIANTSESYAIKLDEPGLVKVDFSSYIDYGVEFQLEDSNGVKVLDEYVKGGEPADSKKWLGSEYLEAGIYYIKVNEKYGYTGKYDLVVNFEGTKNTEIEPNNGTEQAADIGFDKKMTGLISWNDSNDTYKVTVQEPGLLNVNFSSFIDYGVDIQLEDSNGTKVLGEYIKGGNPTDSKVWMDSEYLEAGVYYLKINKKYDYTGKYDFEVNFEETKNNEIEPNNGTELAADITFDKQVTGLVSWNDSVDAYQVTVQSPGLLNMNFFSYIAYGVNIQLEDSNGMEVSNEYVRGGEPANPEKWSYSEYLEPGVYYIKITSKYGYTGKYDLEVNFEESKNKEAEPNNGTEQAGSLEINEQITGLISWNDNLDTYTFTMQEPGDIHLDFSSYIDSRVSLKLVDDNGKELLGESIWNGKPATPKYFTKAINLEAGKYYVQVAKVYDYTGKYDLSVNIKSGWIQENNNWYYYTSEGKQTGWMKDRARWYFLDSNGVMQTGWLDYGDDWYYLHSSGVMATGWTKSGGHWYFMNGSGEMETGWLKEGGKWYLLQSSGAMTTGWTKSGSQWYFMDSSGVMETGWLKDGTKWYYLTSSGAMAKGWISVRGSWYYMYSNGTMASSTTIGGYKLEASGAWIR
jgi:cell wall-associated protease